MIVLFQDVDYDNVAVIDAEYSEGDLIQFAGIMFRKIGESLYQTSKTENIYVKLEKGKSVNFFIQDFTGITDAYLEVYGQTLTEAKKNILEFLDVEGTLALVSHDIRNDNDMLYGIGIDLEKHARALICTYRLAQLIYGEAHGQKLNLGYLAEEAGFKHSNNHNAMDDVWATTAVFSLLNKLKMEKEDENEIF